MAADGPRRVLHWRDFVCPFCYVGQTRTTLLRSRGWEVVELPFPIHPEIPAGGVAAGPRVAPFYRHLENEAERAGLPLHWPDRLPNTRFALTLAEAVRRTQPHAFAALDRRLFAAHFAEERDIGDPQEVWAIAEEEGVDAIPLRTVLEHGEGERALVASVESAAAVGVTGTPAWLLPSRLITGLQPAAEFEHIPPAPALDG